MSRVWTSATRHSPRPAPLAAAHLTTRSSVMSRVSDGKRSVTLARARPGPASLIVRRVALTPPASWQSQIGSPSRIPTSPEGVLARSRAMSLSAGARRERPPGVPAEVDDRGFVRYCLHEDGSVNARAAPTSCAWTESGAMAAARTTHRHAFQCPKCPKTAAPCSFTLERAPSRACYAATVLAGVRWRSTRPDLAPVSSSFSIATSPLTRTAR